MLQTSVKLRVLRATVVKIENLFNNKISLFTGDFFQTEARNTQWFTELIRFIQLNDLFGYSHQTIETKGFHDITGGAFGNATFYCGR
jgi:hypothetical protein